MENKKSQPQIDKKTALLKAESYCAYQERSQAEVRHKLLNLGLRFEELEEVISELIANNFLNEARFALAYAQGKLRMKGWGKAKIKQGLKLKGVSEPILKKTLQALPYDEYEEKLGQVLEKKYTELGVKTDLGTKNKLIRFGMSRGFEYELIFLWLKNKGLGK